ncbi:MAG TPA: hypothetical protein VFG62_19700 [Rhodopila sp.]|jgi:hypothetical protein|nr:hypothetical protein [Rhodopila sp.]
MALLKIRFDKPSAPANGRESSRGMFETLFYITGLALMLITIVAVAVIVCGIIYCLFDVLILHRVPFDHLPINR